MRKKRIVLLLIIIFIIYFGRNTFFNLHTLFSGITNHFSYQTIKQDRNSNYSGIGQKRIENQDGYFTTFTTTTTNQKTYIEYKQNGTSSWSNQDYWGGSMADNGCGITAIASILSGYHKNYTPDDLRQKYYPVLDNDSIPNELQKTFSIKNSGFYYDSMYLSEKKLQEHLKTNRPILICVWNKPHDNRWTTSSHYMVLLATDDKDMVYVSNPNGGKNDSKSSGWYKMKEVTPYIAKALYIESY